MAAVCVLVLIINIMEIGKEEEPLLLSSWIPKWGGCLPDSVWKLENLSERKRIWYGDNAWPWLCTGSKIISATHVVGLDWQFCGSLKETLPSLQLDVANDPSYRPIASYLSVKAHTDLCFCVSLLVTAAWRAVYSYMVGMAAVVKHPHLHGHLTLLSTRLLSTYMCCEVCYTCLISRLWSS